MTTQQTKGIAPFLTVQEYAIIQTLIGLEACRPSKDALFSQDELTNLEDKLRGHWMREHYRFVKCRPSKGTT